MDSQSPPAVRRSAAPGDESDADGGRRRRRRGREGFERSAAENMADTGISPHPFRRKHSPDLAAPRPLSSPSLCRPHLRLVSPPDASGTAEKNRYATGQSVPDAAALRRWRRGCRLLANGSGREAAMRFAVQVRVIIRAIKRAEVEATPVTRKSPEKLLKFRLLEPIMLTFDCQMLFLEVSRTIQNISRAIKRAEVEATPVTRKSPEKLLKLRLLEPTTALS
uniref:Uncharacterized protein n=1 Tax=Oryza nivara TaxID=4536 RepID=A0A0E0IJV9_ORYNI